MRWRTISELVNAKGRAWIDAARAAGIAALLAVPLLGFQLSGSARGLVLAYRFSWIAYAALAVFFGRLALSDSGVEKVFSRRSFFVPAESNLYAPRGRLLDGLMNLLAVVFALGLPWFSFTDRIFLDRATLVLIYVLLGTGLNIVVRRAGILDLGYAAFYAIGAYSYALLSQRFALSFWECLPISGLIAAGVGLAVASPAVRSRGEVLAGLRLA